MCPVVLASGVGRRMTASPEAGAEGLNLQHEEGRHGAKGCVFLFSPPRMRRPRVGPRCCWWCLTSHLPTRLQLEAHTAASLFELREPQDGDRVEGPATHAAEASTRAPVTSFKEHRPGKWNFLPARISSSATSLRAWVTSFTVSMSMKLLAATVLMTFSAWCVFHLQTHSCRLTCHAPDANSPP